MSGTALSVLLVTIVAALPFWPYSRGWGFAPSGTLGAVVLLAVVMHLSGLP